METYKVRVILEAEIEAPDQSDAEDLIDDHFGVGAGGEGVNVTSMEFVFRQ